MKIIQHRANGLGDVGPSPYAEIDVQINQCGEVVVGHDLWGTTYDAETYLKESGFDKFLIDLKQNLPLNKLQKIAVLFEGRSLGFFDAPFPSAYYARKASHVVWARFSEYEPLNRLFDRFWVDPLAAIGTTMLSIEILHCLLWKLSHKTGDLSTNLNVFTHEELNTFPGLKRLFW